MKTSKLAVGQIWRYDGMGLRDPFKSSRIYFRIKSIYGNWVEYNYSSDMDFMLLHVDSEEIAKFLMHVYLVEDRKVEEK